VHPAKAVGRDEMPFGRDTRVVASNTVLDRGPGAPQEWEIWGSEPPVSSDAAYRQITLAVVMTSQHSFYHFVFLYTFFVVLFYLILCE